MKVNYKIYDSKSVTRIIKDYYIICDEIASIESDIIEGKGNNIGRGGNYGDPTLYKGMALAENPRLENLRMEKEAIKKGLDYLKSRDDCEHACEFIKLYYWSGRYSYFGAMQKVGLSQYRAEDIVRNFRFRVAYSLGKVKIHRNDTKSWCGKGSYKL